MPSDNSSHQAALAALYTLQSLLSKDEEGRVILTRLQSGEQVEGDLTRWIKARQTELPPQLATYISGGQVEKLVNIAQAGVVNIHEAPEIPLLSGQEYRNRKKLLEEVERIEVRRLEESLHITGLINLHKKNQPEQVTQPLSMDVKFRHQPKFLLPPNTPIIKIFTNHRGRLLILGAPGAGKTTTLLELAKALITCAKNDGGEPGKDSGLKLRD